MSQAVRRILLTGFEPFGGEKHNATMAILEHVTATGVAGVDLDSAVLPVRDGHADDHLCDLLDALRPHAVVCLGQSRRAALALERVFLNLKDYRIPDNGGAQPRDLPVVPEGPPAYYATLPLHALLAAIRAAGTPATLSRDAGAFLCNQVGYALMHHLAERGHDIPAGFIHVPPLPEQIAAQEDPPPSMSAETAARGLGAALTLLAQRC